MNKTYELIRHDGDSATGKTKVVARFGSSKKANERRHHERAILPLGSSDWFTVRER